MGAFSSQVTPLFLQELAGLAAFCFEFQRPLFSILSNTFFWVSHPRAVAPHPDLVDEFLLIACVACSMYTDSRMGVDPEPIAIDASTSGGGSCVGVHLDPKWLHFWDSDFKE
eukprot:8404032-Karenia_brevis.AAC.1